MVGPFMLLVSMTVQVPWLSKPCPRVGSAPDSCSLYQFPSAVMLRPASCVPKTDVGSHSAQVPTSRASKACCVVPWLMGCPGSAHRVGTSHVPPSVVHGTSTKGPASFAGTGPASIATAGAASIVGIGPASTGWGAPQTLGSMLHRPAAQHGAPRVGHLQLPRAIAPDPRGVRDTSRANWAAATRLIASVPHKQRP